MMKPEKFIKIIRQSFIGAEQVYTQGSCIMFYKILKAVFPEAKPYWSKKGRHMITRIGDKYYDITGEVVCTKEYKPETRTHDHVSVCVASPKKKLQWHKLSNPQKL